MVITSRVPVRIDFAGAWTDVPIFARAAGGAVVNAAIDRYVHGRLEIGEDPGTEGIRVSYHTDLPSGSGLGTSSSLNVCWLSLVQSQIDPDSEDRARIAETAFKLEEVLGILGGKQDQYAAALGGFHFFRFTEEVTSECLDLSSNFTAEIEKRLVLCYTGKSRLSGSIHENVWGAFRAGVPETVNALYALRESAYQMKQALLDQEIDAVGSLLGESWLHQKALDSSVTNDTIERLFGVANSAGARTGKACGAGGGGCLLFFTDPNRQRGVADSLAQAGARVIPFHFDYTGMTVLRETT